MNHILERADLAPSTKKVYAAKVREILRWLWTNHGTPKLDEEIRRFPATRPRNVTVEREDIDRLIRSAPRHVKLWLLLCSDLAIRSGTAAVVGPRNYNKETRELAFTTKYGARVTLPVTEELRQIIESCDLNSSVSFVRQLWERTTVTGANIKPHATEDGIKATLDQALNRLRDKLGMKKKFVQHDLRRTTAVALYRHTGYIRDVQKLLGHRNLESTVWYLDNDLRPLKRSVLEILKRPAWRKEQSA
jgi:hypothetical protein